MNKTIYEKESLKLFLKSIIVSKENIDKSDPTNQYHSSFTYLLAVFDTVMKFDIIINDISYFDDFLTKLITFYNNRKSYRDFLYHTNKLLVDTVSKTLNLNSPFTNDDKEQIYDKIYNNYIVNGYCFCTANILDKEKIEREGLLITSRVQDLTLINDIIGIYKHHHLSNPFLEDANNLNKDYLQVTDSPALSYLNALEEPKYISDFYLNSMYFLDKTDDRNLLYRNDLNQMKRKMENLCNIKDFTIIEKDIIMTFINQAFLDLNYGDELLVICVKRSALGRNHLRDYQVIKNELKINDLVYVCAKILDSRYSKDKRYTKILPFEFKTLVLPSYNMLLNEFPSRKVAIKKEIPSLKEEKSKKEPKKNNQGYADVIAMTGLLLIASGITIGLAFHFFGI